MNVEIQPTTTIEEKIKKNLLPDEVNELIVCYSYEKGVLTSKEACEIINATRLEFEDLLAKYGYSIMQDSKENLEIELNASKMYPY